MMLMIEQGAFGAYAHSRDGLVQPYLSEAWWNVVEGAMNAAEELGFPLCMVDKVEWPSGEACDFNLPGSQKSRVVAADPSFHLKRLRPVETLVSGGESVDLRILADTQYAIAARVV